jgi:hypothetical protein
MAEARQYSEVRVISATFRRKTLADGIIGAISIASCRAVRLTSSSSFEQKEGAMLKLLIAGAASIALVGSATAADLPRAQPVYQTAQVGKAPIGKTPIGKTPIGKTPIGKAPLVTKG